MTDTDVKPSRATDGARSRTAESKPEIQIVRGPAGMDLPVFGHVSYRSLGLYGGLTVAGVVGVLEWPVAAAVGVTYALARQ